jgi:formate-dependent phosphoribosylglycinamide formyltransferase (GAR transformylase)
LKGLQKRSAKAYVIADNKLTENGGWDYDLLAVEIERLAELDIDLTLTGMDEIELAKMFDEPQEHVVQEVDYAESFSVVVECSNESEQEKIFNRLDSEGYKCRVQSL